LRLIHAPGLVPTYEELRANFRILTLWRWTTGAGALALAGFGALMPGTEFAPWPLVAVGVAHLLYNALVWWALHHSGRRLVALAYGQTLLDLASLLTIFHFTGGVESPCIIYFVIHLFGTALILSAPAGGLLALTATALMTLVARLEYSGRIPHVDVWGATGLYQNIWFSITALLAFVLTTLLLFTLAIAVASRLRRREQEATALYQAARVITSSLEVNEVLSRLLAMCTQTLKASAGIVRLLSSDGVTLEFAAGYGLSEGYAGRGPVRIDQSPIDLQATRGTTVIIADARREAGFTSRAAAPPEDILSGIVAPIPDASGRVLGVLRVYHNTAGHFGAADIPFLTAMTAQAGIALSNALQYQALAEIDEAKMRFVRTITHELRAPVASAQSLMNTLCQGYAGDLSETQSDVVTRIGTRLDLLQELITDLLDLAAGREGQLIHRTAEFLNLAHYVDAMCEHLRPQAETRGVTLTTNAREVPELWVCASPEEIRRILVNVIGNAIKYTPSGGQVSARLVWNHEWLTLEVADTGIGIPADDLPHIWDEFFRARNARERERNGTGLGLAIVKQLVENYGGQIGVRSVEGKGTTFAIQLPQRPTASPADLLSGGPSPRRMNQEPAA
jgi:signal transduction histidine kinase/uncharacterized membrane protein